MTTPDDDDRRLHGLLRSMPLTVVVQTDLTLPDGRRVAQVTQTQAVLR